MKKNSCRVGYPYLASATRTSASRNSKRMSDTELLIAFCSFDSSCSELTAIKILSMSRWRQ